MQNGASGYFRESVKRKKIVKREFQENEEDYSEFIRSVTFSMMICFLI